MAIAAGVYKPPKTVEVIPRCLEHAFEELGFTSPWQLALYLDELSRRSRGKKGRNVAIPREKMPFPGVRAVGVRCKRCMGRGCPKCTMFGWGVLYQSRARKGEHEHKCTPTEAAPATLASSVTSTPTASPAPQIGERPTSDAPRG